MIVYSRFALDTNILVYAADRNAGDKHKAADKLMQDAADKDCFLTLQSLGEFFHATTRKGLASVEEATAYIETWQGVYNVTAANSSRLNDAIEAVLDHKLSFWDALIWATVKQADCAFILSENMRNGRRLDGVEIVNPFLEESGAILNKLLGR